MTDIRHHRRVGDSGDDNFMHERHVIRINGHAKWVVGAVSTALVAALGFLLVADRARIDGTATSGLAAASDIAAKQVLLEYRLNSMQADLADIKKGQQEILLRLPQRTP